MNRLIKSNCGEPFIESIMGTRDLFYNVNLGGAYEYLTKSFSTLEEAKKFRDDQHSEFMYYFYQCDPIVENYTLRIPVPCKKSYWDWLPNEIKNEISEYTKDYNGTVRVLLRLRNKLLHLYVGDPIRRKKDLERLQETVINHEKVMMHITFKVKLIECNSRYWWYDLSGNIKNLDRKISLNQTKINDDYGVFCKKRGIKIFNIKMIDELTFSYKKKYEQKMKCYNYGREWPDTYALEQIDNKVKKKQNEALKEYGKYCKKKGLKILNA